jgi:hypothetical protein
MVWAAWQRERLAVERSLLRSRMPDFQFYQLTGPTYVHGWWESNQRRQYCIQINLPPGYPDECPNTYVTSPSPLLGHRGTPMESHGTSHAMHTWETDVKGTVQICTVRPEYWSATYSIEQLLVKAMLWITAYEGHVRTGRNIDQFLLEYK